MNRSDNTRMTREYERFLKKRMKAMDRENEPRRVKLSGRLMWSQRAAHRYIALKLRFPKYYGGNLDALYDLLSTESGPVEIVILHADRLRARLGEYGQKLLDVFSDATKTNAALTVILVP